MDKSSNLPKGFAVSIRLYQAMLALYPSDFRLVYSGPMLQVFRDCCRRALLEAGTAGLLSLWWRTMLDTMKSAFEEHSQRGVYMSKVKFVKLSGWAFILGAIAFVVGDLAGNRPQYNQYNNLSQPIDRYANVVATPLLVMGLLLISVGLIGLLLRYGQRAGSLGRYSLGLGAISGVIGAVSYALSKVYDFTPLWLLITSGIVVQFLGLAFFGIMSLRQRSLPRWNGLPILAGVGVPIIVLAGTINTLVNGKWLNLPQAITTILFILVLIGFTGLGYLLQTDSQPADITSVAA